MNVQHVETYRQCILQWFCACLNGANSETANIRMSPKINGEKPAKIGGPVLLALYNVQGSFYHIKLKG